MISPLGQRQIFQTANVEAVRQAQEVSEQLQRENARKRVADEHLMEDQASVRVIADSEKIQTDERRGRQGQAYPEERPGGKTAEKPRKDGQEDEGPADSADTHLNLLA